MIGEIINKYFKNFNKILPYILVTFLIELVVLKIGANIIGISDITKILTGNIEMNAYKDYADPSKVFSFILSLMIIGAVLGPIFASFIRLIFKRIIKNEEVDYLQIFKESFKYYFRYIGVILVIFFMIFGLGLLLIFTGISLVIGILFIILFFLGVIYVATVFSPCTEYLIYKDTTFDDALGTGKKVGKKFFWRIILLSIVMGIVELLLRSEHINNIWLYVIPLIISNLFSNFLIFYRMNLCAIYDNSITEFNEI